MHLTCYQHLLGWIRTLWFWQWFAEIFLACGIDIIQQRVALDETLCLKRLWICKGKQFSCFYNKDRGMWPQSDWNGFRFFPQRLHPSISGIESKSVGGKALRLSDICPQLHLRGCSLTHQVVVVRLNRHHWVICHSPYKAPSDHRCSASPRLSALLQWW